MKCLMWLASLCFLALVSFAQQATTVPIIIEGASQSSRAVQVADLKAEVNHESVPVVSLTSLSDKHLQYLLINDARVHVEWSGGADQQEHVAKELIKEVISSGSDLGTLVNYGDQVFLDIENEKDPMKLSAKISATTTGPTRLYDAVVSAANRLAKQPASPDGRKVMFLVCDGRDNESHVSLTDAISTLQKASIPIFVFVPSDLEKKQGQSMLELAERSGGRVYFLPSNTKRLTFDSLKRDLSNSFLLALKSTSQNRLLPLSVADTGNPQMSILYAAQVFVP